MKNAREILRIAALAGPLACLLAASPARAQATPAQVAAAEALYREGWRLIQDGRAAEACPKLEESQRLDPGMGTLFQLARCYEETSRPASAWAHYLDIADHDQKRPRAEEARRHAEALEPLLPVLIVRVAAPSADLAGLILARDETELGRAQRGAPIPVDLGVHRVRASAPGKEPWEATVQFDRLGQRETVTIPALADLPAPPPAPAPPALEAPPPPAPVPKPLTSALQAPSPPMGLSAQKTAALSVGSIGLGVLTTGAVFSALTVSQWSTAKEVARNGGCADAEKFMGCSRDAQAAQERAASFATVSTVGFIAGGAVVAGAAVLWLTAPSRQPGRAAKVRLLPTLGTRRAGLWLEGTF